MMDRSQPEISFHMNLHPSTSDAPLSVASSNSKSTPITNHTVYMSNTGGQSSLDISESEEGNSLQSSNPMKLVNTFEKSVFSLAPHKQHGFTDPTNNNSPIQKTYSQKEAGKSLATVSKIPIVPCSTPHAIHGKLDMQSKHHPIQPVRKMEMQSHQHLVPQQGKLPGKEPTILTVNA